LLKLCDNKLIPEALDQLEKTKTKSFVNAGTQERLERELRDTLGEAAKARRMMGTRPDDEGFRRRPQQRAGPSSRKWAGRTPASSTRI